MIKLNKGITSTGLTSAEIFAQMSAGGLILAKMGTNAGKGNKCQLGGGDKRWQRGQTSSGIRATMAVIWSG